MLTTVLGSSGGVIADQHQDTRQEAANALRLTHTSPVAGEKNPKGEKDDEVQGKNERIGSPKNNGLEPEGLHPKKICPQ